ncbi:MAG: glutamine-hydrolyzing GMP synthase [Candidatus Gracilibacteria bacterium]|jgi:GMP synthase (glutamine-hydrolysing)
MDKIVVLDFGGQYAHLIANRIRRLGVYSEILDGETSASDLKNYKGIIMSGGPASVTASDSVKCDPKLFSLGIPILGICYGHQLMGHFLGGKVAKGNVREYGPAIIKFSEKKEIFKNVKSSENVWMSHFDQVVKAPAGFKVIGKSKDCPIAAMANYSKNLFGIQFHPEVTHTPCGMTILENFIKKTGAKREWNITKYIERITAEIRQKVGNKKVFLLISGGVDSTVAFLLVQKALGGNKIYGLFVDTGFMRMNERKEVSFALKKVGVKNLHVYDASKEYFKALKGVYEPEMKRKIIGDLFLDIQAKVSKKLNLNPAEWILAQGTIYPDTIETGGTKHADKIKTHHNRVPQIQELIKQGKVIEPLSQLYKDEVRLVGEKLGLDKSLVWRHPFPGPGLAVRILCTKKEDYPAKVFELEMGIDAVLKNHGLKSKVLPIKSVGVQGDERTYRHPVVIFGKKLSWEILNKISTQLINQFPEINRVLLGLKPAKLSKVSVHNVYLNGRRTSLLQKADKIVMDFIKTEKILKEIWQFPTVLIPVCVGNTNCESLVLRPVCSEEAMTANFYRMAPVKLSKLVKKLFKLKGISGIFYDITNKPPGTIEWE